MLSLTQGNLEDYDFNSIVLKASINNWDTDSPARGYFVFPSQRLSDKILDFKRSTQKLFFPYFSIDSGDRVLVVDNQLYQLTGGTIPMDLRWKRSLLNFVMKICLN